MITSRINLLAVGAFVIAMIASLVVAVAVLAGRSGETDRYHTVYPNVAGLKFGSQVLYEGYPIGQIEQIVPQEADGGMVFRVELSVIKGWRIPEDSLASISIDGVLSPAAISISAGSSARSVTPGELIPPGGASGLFSAFGGLSDQLGRISDEGLLPLLNNLNTQVTVLGELLDGDTRQTLAHLNSLSAQLDEHAPVLLADLRSFSGSLTQASDLIESSSRAARSLDRAAARIDSLLADNAGNIDVTTAELRSAAEALSGRAQAMSHNLDAASRDLAEFSRQLRQDPSRVLRPTRGAEVPTP